jgi:hypothetical protein
MSVSRADSASSVIPSAVSTSNQDFLVIGGSKVYGGLKYLIEKKYLLYVIILGQMKTLFD